MSSALSFHAALEGVAPWEVSSEKLILEPNRVLKTAALDNGAGYWDMYEVMGGRNSMPQWVAADPPLAAPDYVHFTRAGARKIAELFYDALIKDYEEYTAR